MLKPITLLQIREAIATTEAIPGFAGWSRPLEQQLQPRAPQQSEKDGTFLYLAWDKDVSGGKRQALLACNTTIYGEESEVTDVATNN